jgi:hydrogenase maturation protein HypF
MAHERDLTGWVRNTSAGVELEVQGSKEQLNAFDAALNNSLPPLASITAHTCSEIPVAEEDTFKILPSGEGIADVRISPDSAVCKDCLQEMLNPTDRRYRYPFITCTNCGPRYSIITGIPYDRPKTTMSGFPLCPDCLKEYNDPMDRRFHAQPIACHNCGPQVSLLNSSGEFIAEKDAAVVKAIILLRQGSILAVKGIGGYHLAVDACNLSAVKTLRERKKRDEKPFAVMTANLESARELALMNKMEERLLTSSEAPIVIVRKRRDCSLSPLVAPANGWIGLMLPYAPLQHLLFERTEIKALVMTSGNISDEPVAYEDDDALTQLSGIADYFLCHNRPIHIRSDDSVMRVFQEQPLFYRRARGFAPRAVKLPFAVQPILATGAELKSAVCLANSDQAFLSQHIGDLKNESTNDSFCHTVKHFTEIFQTEPELIACDLHPDYHSSLFAEKSHLPIVRVQHHHAHIASCMAENGLTGDVIGIIYDGTGYGPDGTIWGGEILVGGYESYIRAAHLRPVALPGGDAAVREPWRMAMSYLYQATGEAAFSTDTPAARQLSGTVQEVFSSMLRRGINSPLTTSCGRLFDAVAALLNIRLKVSYDGQAAIELEALAETADDSDVAGYTYTVLSKNAAPFQLDFSPMFIEILNDISRGIPAAVIALRFHFTVAAATSEVCVKISQTSGLNRVVLSGGVFQNRLLSEMIYNALVEKGLKVFTHRLVSPNDGGIALGQVAIAGKRKV